MVFARFSEHMNSEGILNGFPYIPAKIFHAEGMAEN